MADIEQNYDTPIEQFGIEQPAWIERKLTVGDIQAIVEGGCASGAYMPAVTYRTAVETMSEHGDHVLDYIEDALGEVPQPKRGESWSGIAVFFLSVAVELWASAALNDIDSA